MLFTCRPPGLPIPGRFPGPAHARGKWFAIDIHCHVRCDKATAMVEGNEAVSRWYLETQASPQSQAINQANGVRTALQSSSPEQRIADMDHMGIDIQAISPAPRQTYYGADPDLGLAVSREINDFMAEICGRYPDRFVGLGTIPFQAPDLAIAELERLHKSLGFRGIEIMTHVAGEDLSAPRFRKIFARCEELGMLVFMHSDGFTEAGRFHDHYFANVIGNPLDTTVAVHHLIFGGVLEDYPNLKLVLSHGGGFLPAYSGRIDHGASARPDTCECIRHMPTTYLKRLYFDTIVYTHHQLEYLVEQYGADHILMGTDYPADMGENDPIGFVEGAAGLDDSERRAILGRNAARLLNIEIPHHE
ncbi:MAG TPA: amidohydrolase family protein [Stellaceae bacterium]|jgi:aminocarboxymuconate-semialdehyde decarboxylase|nr:amidohydrolase family protein [Stellaceae bacterium]